MQGGRSWWPFVGGILTGAAGLVLWRSLQPRPSFDARLLRLASLDTDVPPTVIVPGILGSELLRGDGTQCWLNAGNALGQHDLCLPLTLPLADSKDELVPGGLLGVDAVLPRLFGFTEYADLVDLLRDAGFRRDGDSAGLVHHVCTYDWRRDLVESARRLAEFLDALAEARGEPDARFNVIGHSMGGLVARYYLRYGTAAPEEDAPVTWAGARRIRNLLLVATPNGGSINALDAMLNGNRVGLSSTTLAAPVVWRMPAIFELLPPPGSLPLVSPRGEPLELDLLDPLTWERQGWGPFAKGERRRQGEAPVPTDPESQRAFAVAALERARAFQRALAREPDSSCPARVVILGGDCLPTLARAVLPDRPGALPRFAPWTRQEAELLFDAGDGRVTRASVLASHLPRAQHDEEHCGVPEASHVFFGAADHHGIYGEPTFQSILLRILMRPAPRPALAAVPASA